MNCNRILQRGEICKKRYLREKVQKKKDLRERVAGLEKKNIRVKQDEEERESET